MIKHGKLIGIALALAIQGKAAYSAPAETDEIPVAEGRITYAGKSLAEITTATPTLWLRNEKSGKSAEGEVRYEDGYIQIYNLEPGEYGLQIRVDLNRENPDQYPGDLRTFERFKVVAGETTNFNPTVSKLIHLIKPVDNAGLVADFDAPCQNKKAINTRQRFEWEPIAEAKRYYYKLMIGTCSPHTSGYVLDSGYTTDTHVDLELIPTTKNQYYSFSVLGRTKGDSVGSLMVHGRSGWGWEYRFKVKQ